MFPSKPFNNGSKVLWMSVDNWALADVGRVVVFEVLTGPWAQLMLLLFVTILFKIIFDWYRSIMLFLRWSILWIECPRNMLGSWNCWICDFPVYGLCVVVAARGNNALSKGFSKVIWTCWLAVLPVDGTSWWLSQGLAWLINIILPWSKSTSIVGESCYLCH